MHWCGRNVNYIYYFIKYVAPELGFLLIKNYDILMLSVLLCQTEGKIICF